MISINRTSLYCKSKEFTWDDIDIMNHIDKIHIDFPGFGIEKINDRLKRKYNIKISKKVTRSYMVKMNILKSQYSNNSYRLYPYLLKKIDIYKPNKVWSIDITYIGMENNFLYLVVIIDWFSRFVLSWELSKGLKKESVIIAVKDAIKKYGKPEVINSDNGSQFISGEYLELLVDNNIRISMNRKGRPTDNIAIERFFRSLKSERLHHNEIYHFDDAYKSINFYIDEYNSFRGHNRFKNATPREAYFGEKEIEVLY